MIQSKSAVACVTGETVGQKERIGELHQDYEKIWGCEECVHYFDYGDVLQVHTYVKILT